MSGKCPYHKEPAAEKTAPKCPYHKPSEKQAVSSTDSNTDSSMDQITKSEHAAVNAAVAGDKEKSNLLMKKHFKLVYDSLAEEHSHSDDSDLYNDENIRIIKILISKLGYTEDQLLVIGTDVLRMQGTGNPHLHADIQSGNTVVDLGSGFGIDAFLAGQVVGDSGHVIGIDQSDKEIMAAIQRVAERQMNNVDFRIGDIEKVPVPDNSVDRVISNGGFCLVPDKRKAFQEIARILKPGGKFSISCTVRCKPLDPNTKWPSCMHVFMDLNEVNDIVTKTGLNTPQIDDSNSSMTLWDKDIPKPQTDSKKVGIHRNDESYNHLKQMDMNELFARVTIYSSKPK